MLLLCFHRELYVIASRIKSYHTHSHPPWLTLMGLEFPTYYVNYNIGRDLWTSTHYSVELTTHLTALGDSCLVHLSCYQLDWLLGGGKGVGEKHTCEGKGSVVGCEGPQWHKPYTFSTMHVHSHSICNGSKPFMSYGFSSGY